MTTLMDFTYKKKYKAEPGENGAGSKCFGKDGKDMYIKVPMGTVVKEATSGKIIADLSHDKDECVVARGGKGGKGNVRFTTPTRQAPSFAEPGMPRSEEHTSELQSRQYLVCRLLLEKKKNKKDHTSTSLKINEVNNTYEQARQSKKHYMPNI